ncbi:MAG: PLP-dependent aspartate aminotransferase family protein [Tannerella sp.]|nr:PLP-dependent aspartate aminotransferase family protein [Tannerella sp.]
MREKTGITDTPICVSVGIEGAKDLIHDLKTRYHKKLFREFHVHLPDGI